MSLFLATGPGLEPALLEEARQRGWSVAPRSGGVEVEGPPERYREANLWLRTANRVLLRVARIGARDGREVLEQLRGTRLDAYAEAGTTLALKYSGDAGAP